MFRRSGPRFAGKNMRQIKTGVPPANPNWREPRAFPRRPQGRRRVAGLRRPGLSCSIAPSWGPSVAKRSEVEAALRRLAPRIPPHEFGAVVDHALDSRGLRSSAPETAAWLSLVAYVRHALTDYDDLLTQGYDQDSARYFVAGEIESVLGEWGVRRRLGAQE
jgi:hypothetical protein